MSFSALSTCHWSKLTQGAWSLWPPELGGGLNEPGTFLGPPVAMNQAMTHSGAAIRMTATVLNGVIVYPPAALQPSPQLLCLYSTHIAATRGCR